MVDRPKRYLFDAPYSHRTYPCLFTNSELLFLAAFVADNVHQCHDANRLFLEQHRSHPGHASLMLMALGRPPRSRFLLLANCSTASCDRVRLCHR
jgi:hypothetical protein